MMAEEMVTGPARFSGRATKVGIADVRRLRAATRALRARDHREGGGSCRWAVLEQLALGHTMLHAQTSDAVRDRLVAAVADLHNLAGWTDFDTGRPQRAAANLRYALELIEDRDQHALEANLRYRLGRIHLHQHDPDNAMTEFTRSLRAAVHAGSAHAEAIASVNLAWAHAMRGSANDAVTSLNRGQEQFAQARGPVPSWARFFDATDLAAMVGTVYTELATRVDRHFTHHAIPALATATRDYDDTMSRSRVFCLTMLAIDHVVDGDLDGGAELAMIAADRATDVSSVRVADRMRPLYDQVKRHHRHPGMAEATERIGELL
jgi:tetratricopeptide (TPR) repeat protein